MLKKNVNIIVVFLLLTLLSTACVPINKIDNNDSKNKIRDLTLDSNINWPTAPDKIDDKFRNSILEFSWDLFQGSSKNIGNVLISPASVYLALGMTYNGADGDTRQAIAPLFLGIIENPAKLMTLGVPI